MTAIAFLAQWAIRSSILIVGGVVLLRLLRVKDPSVRLAAWTAMLCASLALPALATALPKLFLRIAPAAGALPAALPVAVSEAAGAPVRGVLRGAVQMGEPFSWAEAALFLYAMVAGLLLLRLCAGLLAARWLLRDSRAAGCLPDGIEIRESARVGAPVTLGLTRPAIVVPEDWRSWDSAKIEAVLAHERSHIERNDPAIQALSALHRALLWHSPMSWLLHRRIVRLAEEASDDAALAATNDRASYAEVLLDFMRRGVRGPRWQGVAMARYDLPEERIHRILHGTTLSGGVSRASALAIAGMGVIAACVAASAEPQLAAQARSVSGAAAAQVAVQDQEPASSDDGRIRRYMIFLGDSTSGSWDSRDPVDQAGLRARFGNRFAWFRRSGNEYVVTDAGVLDELEKAMEPQQKVNEMQSVVNSHQGEVNEEQSKVNALQNEVNALQQEVNRRQNLVNRIQQAVERDKQALMRELETALRELKESGRSADQQSVNRSQAEVNKEQARVNELQHKVNLEQQKVNAEQQRVNAVYGRRIQEILTRAVEQGLVHRIV